MVKEKVLTCQNAERRCFMRKYFVFVVMGCAVLSGCLPGKANLVVKTSEIRKALRGEVAHLNVTVCTETVLSNAYEKVSFGGGKYTNQLDVIRALLNENGEFKAMMKSEFLKHKWCPNDRMRMWIEEKKGALPVFKSEITLEALLAQQPVLDSLHGTTNSMELCVLAMKDNGTIAVPEEKTGGFNPRISETYAFIEGFLSGFDNAMEFFCDPRVLDKAKRGKGNDYLGMMIVPGTVLWATCPLMYDEVTIEIVGDGDPVYVISEDVGPNGAKVKEYDGLVKKGDRVKLKRHKNGEIRFMLDKPRP